MKYQMDRLFALLTSAALALALAAPAFAGGKSLGKPSGVVPATVEPIAGSDLHKVTLTEKAAQRIDLKTDSVRQAHSGLKTVPYSSLIYGPRGETWIYTVSAPRTFVRAAISVDTIEGDKVFFRQGPSVGTQVASVGVAEIYGTEFAVGH